MSERQQYPPDFERRVRDLYMQGYTAKPMLKILIPEFPELTLDYKKLIAYIDYRQKELTDLRDEYQAELTEARQFDAKLTAKRVHVLEQKTLRTLEDELERCRTAITSFQPWDKEYAQINRIITSLIKDIEKLGKTSLMRKVEETQAVTQAKEAAKGKLPSDPLEQSRLAEGRVIE